MSKQSEFLKSVRKKSGLTQKQFADKLNVSDKVVSKWETGESFPNSSLLSNISEVLNVDVNELLNGEYSQKEKQDNPVIKENNKEEKLQQTNNMIFVTNVNSNGNGTKVSDEKVLDKLLGLDSNDEIQCSKCGSCDVDIKDDYAICKHCGAKIQLKKFTYNETTNNINNYYGNDAQFFSNLYYVNGKLKKEEFYRNLLLTLSLDKRTPVDILEKSDFSEISLFYSQFLIANVHFEGFVTADVGYNREEQYEDYEYKTSNGHTYKSPVTKTRTVTDWKPFSTNVSSTELCCAGLGKTNDNDSGTFVNQYSEIKNSSNTVPFEKCNKNDIKIEPCSEDDLTEAIMFGEIHLKSKVKFPGDKVKNESYNISHNVLNEERYVVPTYQMKYKYNNSPHEMRSFLTKYSAMGDIPDVSKEINKEIDKKSNGYRITSNLFSFITLLFSILLCFVIKDKSLIWLNIVLLVISIISFIVYKTKRNSYSKNTYLEKSLIKRDKLKEYLDKKNLAGLSQDEMAMFEVK